NRLNLLIDVAAAVAGASDDLQLARTVTEAAVRGTGFPRAALLRDAGASNEVRVGCEAPAPGGAAGAAPGGRAPAPPSARSVSPSLIAEAGRGEVARLTSDQPMSTAESVMRLGIQTALCAPIMMGTGVGGFLYLDARTGEGGPELAHLADRRAGVASVQNDA